MNEIKKLQSGEAEVSTAADKAKLAIATVLLLGGIVGYYLLASQAGWIRWLAVVAGLVLGIIAFATSTHGSNAKQFFLDSRVELRKVVWPSRQDTGKTTLAVFVFVIIAGVFFWLLDLALGWATRALTGQGG